MRWRQGCQILNDAGIPTFETPEQAVDTFMEMYFYSRHLELLQETPPRLTQELSVNTRQARTFLWPVPGAPGGRADGTGIQGHPERLRHPGEPHGGGVLRRRRRHGGPRLGFPVALKINSPDISHKSEVDGMRFNLHNENEVKAAYEEIIAAVRAAKPEANILGVTVQTQETARHLRTASSAANGTRISAPSSSSGPEGSSPRSWRTRPWTCLP